MTQELIKLKMSVLLLLIAPLLVAQNKPNVVVITVDTLRADRLSGYGYGRNTSPNIDALLAKSVTFTQARTVEPLTAPALISMITSLYPHEHGASRNGLKQYEGLDSMTKSMARDGYRTAAFVGNWTLKNKLCGMGEHFEEYHEAFNRKRWFGLFLEETTAVDLTRQSKAWLKTVDERPFFLWVHYADPHAPYLYHKEYAKQVGIGQEDKSSKSDRYDLEVAFTDAHVGMLLDTIAEVSENTIIVFASDHGESLGEHDYWGHGRHLYEPTLHIPMSIAWEGKIEPKEIDAPAMLFDVPTTLLGLLDISIPTPFKGYDWSGVLRGTEKPREDRVTFFQAHKGAVQTKSGAKRGRQRGLLAVGVLSNGVKEIYRIRNRYRRVFDVKEDPKELKSLVPKRTTMSEPLRQWALDIELGLKKAKSQEQQLTETEVEKLRSLGYIE